MLNDIITIDLHIHSIYSNLKDEKIVSDSTIENLDLLINKLNENKVNLCAITDHNNFSFQMYDCLKKKIHTQNGFIKENLPGIEFDVKLEEEKPTCHIIAIFDDSNIELVKSIQSNIDKVKIIKNKEDYFTLEEFEKVIKIIGINVIIIVHQKQSLENNNGKNGSLSSATNDPYKFLKVGYIDSLEYNYPKVEGIVKSSLRDVNLDYPLITGSDCHQWKAYPYHDSLGNKSPRNFTKFKCLPTFKGLLMSITSFNTRSNRIEPQNNDYIKEIVINGKSYELSQGINAIIGDNGAGKSLIAGLLGNDIKSYYKKLISFNQIKYSNAGNLQLSEIKYIQQGEIVDKLNSGSLFEENNNKYFDDINNKEIFSTQIKTFFNNIYSYIQKNINKNEKILDLKTTNLIITPITKEFYHPVIKSDIEFEDASLDETRKNSLNAIIQSLELELTTGMEYYKSIQIYDDLLKNLINLKSLLSRLEKICDNKSKSNKVRTIIKNKLDDYKSNLNIKKSTEEKEREIIIKKYDSFKSKIVESIKSQTEKNLYPEFPKAMPGYSHKQFKGYEFTKIAKYNNCDLEQIFYTYCFNKDFDKDKLKSIKTKDELSTALKGYSINEIEKFKANKLEGFIAEYSAESKEISEIDSKKRIGNTPGENALVYFKFTIKETNDDFKVLIMDQPEDNINPLRINEFLNNYLKSIRDIKQIIIVTHSPLLVVNLDVDNVIFVSKEDEKIILKCGSLEYETKKDAKDGYTILNLVEKNLDGGFDAVERRLKVYENDRNNHE
jgi:energy-coupling factor transporter ATP-binding protein EcfA2